ncbi:MAG: hypothetical protein K6F92_07375 [Lachnospiraceae bacterium]|nr:hypothetical protein [Lachnospiraceae bacterium]
MSKLDEIDLSSERSLWEKSNIEFEAQYYEKNLHLPIRILVCIGVVGAFIDLALIAKVVESIRDNGFNGLFVALMVLLIIAVTCLCVVGIYLPLKKRVNMKRDFGELCMELTSDLDRAYDDEKLQSTMEQIVEVAKTKKYIFDKVENIDAQEFTKGMGKVQAIIRYSLENYEERKEYTEMVLLLYHLTHKPAK